MILKNKLNYLTKKNGERAKFKWLKDDDDQSYFEIRIQVDGITKDVSLNGH